MSVILSSSAIDSGLPLLTIAGVPPEGSSPADLVKQGEKILQALNQNSSLLWSMPDDQVALLNTGIFGNDLVPYIKSRAEQLRNIWAYNPSFVLNGSNPIPVGTGSGYAAYAQRIQNYVNQYPQYLYELQQRFDLSKLEGERIHAGYERNRDEVIRLTNEIDALKDKIYTEQYPDARKYLPEQKVEPDWTGTVYQPLPTDSLLPLEKQAELKQTMDEMKSGKLDFGLGQFQLDIIRGQPLNVSNFYLQQVAAGGYGPAYQAWFKKYLPERYDDYEKQYIIFLRQRIAAKITEEQAMRNLLISQGKDPNTPFTEEQQREINYGNELRRQMGDPALSGFTTTQLALFGAGAVALFFLLKRKSSDE